MTGKIIGGVLGALLGGPWGAVIGATAGHFVVDRRKNSFNKVAFFEYLCMVIAKVAKIDGVVSQSEIDAVEALFRDFDIDDDTRESAIEAFRKAKRSRKNAETITEDFAKNFTDIESRNIFMISLCRVALADGSLSVEEKKVLENIAKILHLNFSDYIYNANSSSRSSDTSSNAINSEIDSAYVILGVPRSATDNEIKKAYHQKCKELHPDVLRSKGLGDFALKTLESELARINQAYETIKKYRK